jgi:BA14K-like protein
MNRFTKKLAVIATAFAVMATGFSPAFSMPAFTGDIAAVPAPIIRVQGHHEYGDNRSPGIGNHRWQPRSYHRFDRRGDGYYNGYRGYRDRRQGYRYHNGFWFPLGAFAAGAIIGGAMSQPRAVAPMRPGRYSTAHYSWCQQRYKTYRAADNTYVANSRGDRRFCNSPY